MILWYPKSDGHALPLSERVITAEQQLHHREGAVRACASRFSERFRDRLTAPASLLLAAGAGFLLGELTDRPTAAPASPQPAAPEAPTGHRLLASSTHAFLKLYDLARPLLSTYAEEKLKQRLHASAAPPP